MDLKNIIHKVKDHLNEEINTDNIFKVDKETITLKLTPDKTLTNNEVESLAIALTELYSPLLPGYRIQRTDEGIRLASKKYMFYEISFTPDLIEFYITVPKKWRSFIEGKLEEVFSSKMAIVEDNNINMDYNPKRTEASYIKLKRSDFLSIKTDRRLLAPLPALMSNIKNMAEDDKALLQIGLEPLSPGWADKLEEDYKKYKRGDLPLEKPTNVIAIFEILISIALYISNEIVNLILEIITGSPGENYLDGIKEKKRPKELNTETIHKHNRKGFNVSIRALAESKDKDRARLILKGLEGSFNDLEGDNGLEGNRIRSKRSKTYFINEVRTRKINDVKNKNISKMSTSEVSQLIKLPPNSIQEEYKEIDSIGFNTPDLPDDFKEPGVLLAKVNHRAETHNLYIPDKNPNLFNLPLGVIGPMGCGKSALGSTIARENYLRGRGSAVIDVADGKLCNDIRDSIPEDKLNKVIELDFGAIDRPIYLNWSEITKRGNRSESRLASELVGFFEKFTGELGPRTRRWLKKSGLAVFEDSNNSILEVVSMLVDDNYRSSMIPNIKNQSVKASWIMFNDMSPGERSQIIQPILNRLDYLLDDENIKNCICQRPKKDQEGEEIIDFRKWMDEGYLVLIKVPKSILFESATDTIVSYIVSKIWLATLTRIDLREKGITPRSFSLIMDEPHQFMSSVENWKRMIVESRKWGLKLIYLFHSFEQIKEKDRSLADLFKKAGMDFILFNGNGAKGTFLELKDEIYPYTIGEALSMPKYSAIFRMDSKKGPISFIAKAIEPPDMRYKVLDNTKLSKECINKFGSDVSKVEEDIFKRESSLMSLDIASIDLDTNNSGEFDIMEG